LGGGPITWVEAGSSVGPAWPEGWADEL